MTTDTTMTPRRQSVPVMVGQIKVGGGAPCVVQLPYSSCVI